MGFFQEKTRHFPGASTEFTSYWKGSEWLMEADVFFIPLVATNIPQPPFPLFPYFMHLNKVK